MAAERFCAVTDAAHHFPARRAFGTAGLRWATVLGASMLLGCKQGGETAVPAAIKLTPEQRAALKTRALTEIGVAPQWGPPELVPSDVNSEGWEDSAQISSDGSKLYFQYFPGDMFRTEEVFKFHRPLAQGGLGADPKLYDRYHRGPPRGVNPPYTSDIMVSTRVGERFGPPQRFEYSRDGRNEWGLMFGPDGAAYYVSHDPAKEMNMDIYRNAMLLPIPGRERYNEDNPHFAVTPFGNELFFDCNNRPQSKGKAHIWVTREQGGRYSEPEMLPEPINLPGSTEVQPHLASDDQLYFTSARGGTIGIYSSKRNGRDAWGPPQKVLWTHHKGAGFNAWGLGEPTLTADRQWLYFVVVFDDGTHAFDADVARVRRRS